MATELGRQSNVLGLCNSTVGEMPVETVICALCPEGPSVTVCSPPVPKSVPSPQAACLKSSLTLTGT